MENAKLHAYFRSYSRKLFKKRGTFIISLAAVCLILHVFVSYVLIVDISISRSRTRKNTHEDEHMDIYLRMTTASEKFVKFYDKVLVQSMYYFWPDNFSMVVVLDNERARDHEFANIIQGTFPHPRICFMDPIKVGWYTGKDRMQRDMFYPELCTSKKYVAYVDTDTMFVSRVIPEMLFVDGKPKVTGVYGYVVHDSWEGTAEATANLFKTKEVMRCMSYFPVILKVEHLIKLREYLENLHGMPFDEILVKKIIVYYLSQFNVFCQYIWMFHRDEYVFYLQFQGTNKYIYSSVNREGEEYFTSLSMHKTFPHARVSLHYKYILEDWKSEGVYRHILRASICFMGGFELCPKVCVDYSKDSLRKEMFVFDTLDWTWDSRCMEAQRRHYRELAKFDSPSYRDIIQNACYEVNSLGFKWNAMY